MANRAQSQYLRIFNESTTYYRWQQFYYKQTVSWDNAAWEFHPFNADALIGSATSSESGITISMPADQLAVTAFSRAIDLNHLCELKMYEFDSRLSQAVPQAGQILIGSYIGEVLSISGTFAEIEVSIGSSLSPVGAQVPPRSFSSRLIGNPIKL
jgi:hypothetical protein